MPERDIVFEIKEHLGVLAKYPTGWTKELNLISWNGQPPKFDIRDWDPDHERMGRGVTLHPREIKKIVDLYLSSRNRKVIEEAQAAEARKWDKINASKKQESEDTDVEDKALEEFMETTSDLDEKISEEISMDQLDTSSLVEEPAAVNDGTPF